MKSTQEEILKLLSYCSRICYTPDLHSFSFLVNFEHGKIFVDCGRNLIDINVYECNSDGNKLIERYTGISKEEAAKILESYEVDIHLDEI